MKRYIVRLTVEEREELKAMVSKGKASARRLTWARILLRADEGEHGEHWRDEDIARALDVSTDTCERVRLRFVEEGFEAALTFKSYEHKPVKVTGEVQAHLVALSCMPPPEGRVRWTLNLLANRMVELNYLDSISDEHVRRVLKKTRSSHGLGRSG